MYKFCIKVLSPSMTVLQSMGGSCRIGAVYMITVWYILNLFLFLKIMYPAQCLFQMYK